MEKSVDLKILEFKEQLIEVTNNSNLPLTCIQFVLTELIEVIGVTIEKNITEEKQKLKEKNNSEKEE